MLPVFCPYQSAFTDPCHAGDLAVGLTLRRNI